jgi:hypothetical protein
MVALDALLSKKRQMMNLTRRRGVSPELIGVDLDGANDYGSRASDLTGNADGKTFTFAVNAYIAEAGSFEYFYTAKGATTQFAVFVTSSLAVYVQARNASGTIILDMQTANNAVSINTFSNIIISVNMANSGERDIYINDAASSWSIVNTYTNDNIDFTCAEHFVGKDNSTNYFKGRLAGLFLDYTYRDLSNSANRRLFIDSEGFYVAPPTTGILCVPFDDPSEPFRNDGTGGAFTQNGVIARSGRGVNQYNPAASTFDGSADYLSKSSITGIADGKAVTVAFGVKLDPASSGSRTVFSAHNGSSVVHYVRMNAAQQFNFSFENSSTTKILVGTLTIAAAEGAWAFFAMTADLTNSANRKVLMNGVDVTGSVSWSVYSDDTIDLTLNDYEVGKNAAGTDYMNGELSDVWFDDSYTADLSGFYDTETGKPKFLGIDGSLPTGSPPLVYLPMRGNDAGNNAGTGGDFTVNSGPYTGARGPSEFWSGSMETNGSTQYVSRSSALTGAVDGKLATVAFSYKTDVTTGLHFLLSFSQSGDKFTIYQDAQVISIRGANAAGSTILSQDVAAFFSDTNWHNVLLSFDMADTGKFDLYKDGALIAGSATTHTNDSVKFTTTGVGISADPTGSGKFDGKIGFLYFTTEYIDFSQEANRLLFFDAFGFPVDIGADGSLPTGTPPLIYMNNDFHLGTNLGTGGDFTPQNTPTDGGFVKG